MSSNNDSEFKKNVLCVLRSLVEEIEADRLAVYSFEPICYSRDTPEIGDPRSPLQMPVNLHLTAQLVKGPGQ